MRSSNDNKEKKAAAGEVARLFESIRKGDTSRLEAGKIFIEITESSNFKSRHGTVQKLADKVGVAPRTLHRWALCYRASLLTKSRTDLPVSMEALEYVGGLKSNDHKCEVFTRSSMIAEDEKALTITLKNVKAAEKFIAEEQAKQEEEDRRIEEEAKRKHEAPKKEAVVYEDVDPPEPKPKQSKAETEKPKVETKQAKSETEPTEPETKVAPAEANGKLPRKRRQSKPKPVETVAEDTEASHSETKQVEATTEAPVPVSRLESLSEDDRRMVKACARRVRSGAKALSNDQWLALVELLNEERGIEPEPVQVKESSDPSEEEIKAILNEHALTKKGEYNAILDGGVHDTPYKKLLRNVLRKTTLGRFKLLRESDLDKICEAFREMNKEPTMGELMGKMQDSRGPYGYRQRTGLRADELAQHIELDELEMLGDCIEARLNTTDRKEEDAAWSSRYTQAEIDNYFQRFYAIYPRKIAKQRAAVAFTRCVRNGGPRSLAKTKHCSEITNWPEFLITTVQQYADKMKGADPNYIPHPSTWLNDARYFDNQEEWNRPVMSKREQEIASRRKKTYTRRIQLDENGM